MIVHFLIWLLAVCGVTNTIVREKVFEKPRNIVEKYFKETWVSYLFNCETCMGFYVGIMLVFLLPYDCGNIAGNILISGFASSFANKAMTIWLYKL